jgi:ribosome-binding protein aMBF1 (putative translation factor)
LGFSDWLTGTNCAECGRKIQGTRFARTVMGTSVWVCSACNEKQQEERRLETERNAAAAEERRLENFVAQQKLFAEACQHISRSCGCGVPRL